MRLYTGIEIAVVHCESASDTKAEFVSASASAVALSHQMEYSMDSRGAGDEERSGFCDL